MIFNVVKDKNGTKRNRETHVSLLLKKASSSVLNMLHSSKNVYHITGSRYFLTHKRDSDYDLFALKCFEVIAELEALGFKPLDPIYNSYNDLNTAKVYRLDNIDVQLVKDDKLKLEVQMDNYKLLKEITSLDKVTKRMIWDLLFERAGTKKTLSGIKYPFVLYDKTENPVTINNEDDLVKALIRAGCTLEKEVPKVPWPTNGHMGFTTQLWITKVIGGLRTVRLGNSEGTILTHITQDQYGVFPPGETRVAMRTPDNKIELL